MINQGVAYATTSVIAAESETESRVQLGNSKIKWNFKKNKKLKVELNTVCQWLVVCLKFM